MYNVTVMKKAGNWRGGGTNCHC